MRMKINLKWLMMRAKAMRAKKETLMRMGMGMGMVLAKTVKQGTAKTQRSMMLSRTMI